LSFEFDYRVLSGRLRIKTFAEAIYDEQEWHLTLRMLTSEMAHAERGEIESTCKTTTRQSLSN
jgi:hypothetical protein